MCTGARKFIFIADIEAAIAATGWENATEENVENVREAALAMADQLVFEAEGELIVVQSENEARSAELHYDLDTFSADDFTQMVWDHLGGFFHGGFLRGTKNTTAPDGCESLSGLRPLGLGRLSLGSN